MKLKPCLCGSKNLIITEAIGKFPVGDDDNMFYRVDCSECKVNAYWKTKEDAIKAWNKRG